MSKQTYLARYSYIIERLERGPATYEELADYLERKSEITGDDLLISQRTLQRDINDIYTQMGYEIVNERKGDKRYFIKERPQDSEKTQRLLESYQVINIINASSRYNDKVFIESRQAGGMEHFHGLLHAIINKLPVSFNYTKFSDDSEAIREVHPLALKEAIGRWYLAAVDTKDKTFKTFGLDRLNQLELHKKAFRENYNYDMKELFQHAFGVVNDPTIRPEQVKLCFTFNAGKYVKTYPLHQSQKVISEDKKKDEVIIELNLVIAYDFKKEILSYGNEVMVVSPTWLKKEIKTLAQKTADRYK